MRKSLLYFALLISGISSSQVLFAETTYAPAKVVYDVSSPDATVLNNILDRASMLQNVYANNSFEASIVIVLHEAAIPLFSKSKQQQSAELVRRANSLTMGEIIQFRLCSASARMQGFSKKDFHDFITMVPMADAEIVQLENSGYAYLR